MVYVENPENSTVNFWKFRYLFDIFDIIPEFSTNVENFDYFGSFGKAFELQYNFVKLYRESRKSKDE